MKQYEINRHVLGISWLYLLLWVIAISGIIILIGMGSPYWYFPMPGLVFLYLWLMLATLYPRSLVVGEDGITIGLTGSSKVDIIEYEDFQIEEKGGYYELAVTRKGSGRKYLVSRKGLPEELEQHFRQLMER